MSDQPDTRRAYVVSVELEVLVYAKDAEDAKRIAFGGLMQDEMENNTHQDDLEAKPATHLPWGYEVDDLIWGDGKCPTIADALANTPEYRSTQQVKKMYDRA